MNILFITQDYAPKTGGIETYCTELSHNLHAMGYTVDIICPSHKGDSTYTSPLSITRIPIHPSYMFIPLLFVLPFMLRKKKYTHIIYGQWQNAIWHLFFPWIARKYVTVTLVHGRELLTSVFKIFTGAVARKILGTINHALPNSNAVYNLLVAKKACPATIVHPGTNTDTFFPVDASVLREKYSLENKIIIGHITRLVKRKNSIQLITLLPKLLERNSALHLVIGGSGPEKESLVKKVRELKLEQNVTFLGFIPNDEINAHFNLADMFVLPSTISDTDIEGFGIVYIEANCCGIPVIGYNCGGVVDAIEHGKSGFLCDPSSNESLFSAILELADNRELRLTLGAYGRERALSHFSWSANAKKVASILSV